MSNRFVKEVPQAVPAGMGNGKAPLYGNVTPRRAAVRIAVIYAIVSTVWVLCSGWLVHHFIHDEALEAELENAKGMFFVVVTALLLGWALYRILRQAQKSSQKLAATELRLRLVGDNLPDSYIFQYTRDQDGRPRFTYMSAGVERVHGVTVAQILKDPMAGLSQIDPAQMPEFLEAEARSARDMTDFEMDLRMHRPDGVKRIVHARSRPRRREDGQIIWDGVAADVTEHRQANEQILHQAGLINSLLDSIPDIVFFKDLNGVILGCNSPLARFVGKHRAEIVGRTDYDLFPKEVATAFREADQAVQERREPQRVEEWVTYPDGVRVLLDTVKTPYWGPHGELLGVLGISRDITVRREVELALQESNERYRSLFKNLLNGFAHCRMIFDEAGQPVDFIYLDVNPAFEKQTGLKDVIGKRVTEAIPGILEKDPHLIELYGRVACTGVPERFETYVEALKSWYAIAVYQPTPGHFVALFDVVTERKQAELALRQSEENFRAMFELASIGMVQVDPATGRFLRVNRKVCEMTGYSEAELLQLGPRDITHPDDLPTTKEQFSKLIRGEIPSYRVEKRYLHKDGSIVWVNVNVTLIWDATGTPARTMTTIEDITGRKQLEAQFLRAQRLEAIGSLASGVAHDLNNILSPVLMCAPLLRPAVTEPESLKLLDTIENCARRGGDIVRQLLTYARGRPGTRVPLPLRHQLREMEKLIAETFPRSIQPQLVAKPGLWAVLGDSTQLHQALMNLCVNARDALPAGGTITLGAENCAVDEAAAVLIPNGKPGNYVRVSVADNGTGIPPAIIERIFDPFFTTKEPGKGTGLGLATVLGIVNGHGGFVNVRSEEGRGTTFDLYLPASAGEIEEPGKPGRLGLPRANGELVLLVDDEAPIRESARKMLERQGYRVVTAANGAEGLEQYARHRDELRAIVTDMMMPRVNGAVFVQELERQGNEVPVLGVTGLVEGTPDINVAGLKLAKLIPKPFPAEELLVELRKAINES